MQQNSQEMMEEIDNILEAMTTGKDPVILCGLKEGQPFLISNINKAELRKEILDHFSQREAKLTKLEAI